LRLPKRLVDRRARGYGENVCSTDRRLIRRAFRFELDPNTEHSGSWLAKSV
jgi:hypothetical protein